MKIKKCLAMFSVLLLIPCVTVLADTAVGTTNWGGWEKTQSPYNGLIKHSTNVYCMDDSGLCEAGGRTYTDGIDMPPYQRTRSTKPAYGWIVLDSWQGHIHDYYGGWLMRESNDEPS